MKKAVTVMILVCCCIFTACGSTEINKTLYVSSAGISFVKDIYCISVSGKTASENGAKAITAVGRGRTAAQALEKASESSGLAIFFGHCTRITADCGALRNSGLLGELSESVISPSCRVYYSDKPCENGDTDISDGYRTELFKLVVCSREGIPAAVPCAGDTRRFAVITPRDMLLLDEDDSFGLSLLKGEGYPQMLTVDTPDGARSVKIDPKVKRRARIENGSLIMSAEIKMNVSGTDKNGIIGADKYTRTACRSVFYKLINVMGADAAEIYKLTDYNKTELENAKLELRIV